MSAVQSFVLNDSIWMLVRMEGVPKSVPVQMGLYQVQTMEKLVGLNTLVCHLIKELVNQKRLATTGNLNAGTGLEFDSLTELGPEFEQIGIEILGTMQAETYRKRKFASYDWIQKQLSSKELTKEEKRALITDYEWTDCPPESIPEEYCNSF